MRFVPPTLTMTPEERPANELVGEDYSRLPAYSSLKDFLD